MAKKNKKLKHIPGNRQKRNKGSVPPGVSSLQRVLQEALAHHHAGRLQQAEALYRQILAAEPNHPDTLHFLGMLAHQVGKSDIGVELINQALFHRPDYIEAYINLGNAYRDQGKLDNAISSYQRALTLKPDFADAHFNLGNALRDQGKLEEAIASYRQALTLQPDDVEAYINLGNTLRDQGRLEEAIVSFQQALSVNPDFIEAHNNLGNTLKDQGKLDEAVTSYRRALSLKPDYAEAHYNLGNALRDQGKLDEAVISYRQVLTLQPDYAEAYINLGNTLRDQGKLDEAVTSYRRAFSLKPDYAEAHYNLGTVLKDQGKLKEAVASYRRALTLKPDYAEAHNNLGNALKDQGKLDEAVASYRQALVLKHDYLEVHSNLLFCLNYKADVTQKEIYNESQQWHERFAESFQIDRIKYTNSLSPDRRLRIGYVSPDFRTHSVAFFIEPVIRSHNREKVEVFCYANVKKPDKVTQRLQMEINNWYSIVGKKHETVADRIQKDRIDILVDLAGHSSDNSLPVFARKPAPVQVTWLGYPNTTGLKTIDYRFTDAIADPPDDEGRLHSEKLIRLEHGFLCYQPLATAPEVGSLPCLEHGYITFGSFNNLTKVTPDVIRVWARILQAVPDSRLLLKAKQLTDDETRMRFNEMFAREGIAPERLEMHSRMLKQEDHLGLYSRVDIGLDPFPYNGTTTTCEALWLGVPVITLLGNRHAGRVGASILHRLGLGELIASSAEKYIELAGALTLDRKRLQKMRSSLRSRMQESELMNSRRFTRHLEDVYYQMWREYRAKS
jgi:predicted O-linked N-acetylglucosamine transferase (SPINDLY family)